MVESSERTAGSHDSSQESLQDDTQQVSDGIVEEMKQENGTNGMTNGLSRSLSASSVSSPPKSGTKPSKSTKSKSAKIRRSSSRLSQQNILKNLPTLNASPIILEKPPSNKKKMLPSFVEPDLAEPAPTYTGLPLETFPTPKIKKESLWPAKQSKKSAKSSTNTSRETSRGLSPELDFDEDAFEECNQQLKTTLSEDLTTPSDIREPLRIKLRQSRINNKTPRQPKRSSSTLDTPPTRSAKKIKIISPVKAASTNLAPSSITSKQGGTESEDDPTKDNDDYCSACGGPGVFICCETCPKSFHFTCCDPPLEEAPENDWNCRECIAERHPSICSKWDDIGIFAKLMNQQESRNPTEFELPREIRENTFIGVTTGEHGEFTDDSTKPELSYSKSNGAQIPGYNKNEDLEIDSLYDKDGNPYLCHKCGKSGLYNRILTHCDYCPLVWHIDCLIEPVFGPKTIGSKWKCPNHIDDFHQKLREFKETTVIDSTLHNHFLRVVHSTNMLIQHEDQPKLIRYPNLQEYIQYENDDFAKPNEEFDTWKRKDVSVDYTVPDYLSSNSTATGVKASASKDLSKVLCLTTSGPNKEAFIYRVPESLIMLDFVTKVNLEESSIKKKVLENITDYDNLSRLETNDEEREIVEGLLKVKTEPSHKIDFNELINIALKNEGKRPRRKTKSTLKDKEIDELVNMKRLMEIKGKDALVKFLNS